MIPQRGGGGGLLSASVVSPSGGAVCLRGQREGAGRWLPVEQDAGTRWSSTGSRWSV